MRTAAYCRFSSDAQSDTSIRDQLRNIKVYCDRMEWPHPTLFQDMAISGSRTDRPGFLSLMKAAQAGLFDVLLVDDFSRLSRDFLDSGQTVRTLKFLGIRLIGVSDGLDTSRVGYKLETGMRGLMSELYLDDLAEKTHRGLTGQALAGYSAGGLPYGYNTSNDGHGNIRSINIEEAENVRWIFERYVAGDSPRTIAATLNKNGIPSPRGGSWSPTAIYAAAKGVGILGNTIYNGRPCWNKTKWVKDPTTGRRLSTKRPKSEWIITEQPDLKIIDDDLWEAARSRERATREKTSRQRQTQNKKTSGGRGPGYLFSGLLKCGCCGGPYAIVDRYRYGCNIHKDRGDSACSNSAKIARVKVEQILLEGIKKDLMSEEAYAVFERETKELLKNMQPDPSAAHRKLDKARKEAENIMSAIRQGIITPSTKRALEDAEEATKAAEIELQAILAFQPTQVLPRAKEIFRGLVEKLESINDVAAAREALRAIVGEIKLVPSNNGELWAETTQGGLAALCQITVVAGAGFEPTTFGL